jgi:hypothetical protein
MSNKHRKSKKNNRKRVTITLRQYYYVALWLPIIFPPFLLIYSLHDIGISSSHKSFSAGLFGIIQYIIFALWNIFKYRDAVAWELKQFAFKAPFYFIPFYAIGFIVIYMIMNIDIPRYDVILVAMSLSLLCVPVGYLYVFLSYIIELILEKIGFIKEDL